MSRSTLRLGPPHGSVSKSSWPHKALMLGFVGHATIKQLENRWCFSPNSLRSLAGFKGSFKTKPWISQLDKRKPVYRSQTQILGWELLLVTLYPRLQTILTECTHMFIAYIPTFLCSQLLTFRFTHVQTFLNSTWNSKNQPNSWHLPNSISWVSICFNGF